MSRCPAPRSAHSYLEREIYNALRVAGRDPLAVRFTVFIDGINGAGDPFLTTLTGAVDIRTMRTIAADLIRKFADLPLAES